MPFFGIAILFLLQALTGTNAVPLKPANCSAFSKVMAGNEAIGYMMALLYNYQVALQSNWSYYAETAIASNLFEGLEFVGISGLYNHLLLSQDHYYQGFNSTNVPGFFSKMHSNIMRDTCLWLLSYPNQALTLRSQVNCSHPAEQLLLSQYFYLTTKIHRFEFGGFQGQFGCPHQRQFHITWLENFAAQYGYNSEMNFLRGLVYGLGK